MTSPSLESAAAGLDPVTYDTLVNYLDYELPRQQEIEVEKQQQRPTIVKKQRIQPRPLAPALPALAPATTPLIVPAATPATRQILMPKPPVINANILSSLLAATTTPTPSPTVKKTGIKRSLSVCIDQDDKSEDGTAPDEDKRRRNTAASARFRVKKKLREQAMEQSVREMTLKSDKLQDRVNNLESEIKFLRSLLLDKTKN
jgi:hypothetical protein